MRLLAFTFTFFLLFICSVDVAAQDFVDKQTAVTTLQQEINTINSNLDLLERDNPANYTQAVNKVDSYKAVIKQLKLGLSVEDAFSKVFPAGTQNSGKSNAGAVAGFSAVNQPQWLVDSTLDLITQ